MFTLRFSQVFPSLPMGLHKPTFQKRQTSSATSSCIFYLIPNVQKATLPKASVHKGDREALQKSILFEYRESLSHSLPGGVSGRFGARSVLLSPCAPPFPAGRAPRRAQPSPCLAHSSNIFRATHSAQCPPLRYVQWDSYRGCSCCPPPPFLQIFCLAASSWLSGRLEGTRNLSLSLRVTTALPHYPLERADFSKWSSVLLHPHLTHWAGVAPHSSD